MRPVVPADRNPLLALAIALLALAVLVGAFAIGHGIRDRNRNDVITVTGSAKNRIKADYVVWNVSVSAEEPGADMAATMLAGWTSAVRKFFRAERVHADELTVQPIATEAVTAEDTGADATGILGYKPTRTFQIRSSR